MGRIGRGLSAETNRLVARANELWETVYAPGEIRPNVRQYFYVLATERLVLKDGKGYRRVQRVLADARERDDFPWEAVFDPLREVRTPPVWAGLREYLETVRRSYVLDKWQYQERRLEVWVEKNTVIGTLEAVTEEYEVPLLSGHGYMSKTAKREASLRVSREGRTVVYVGDFDPSGVNMLEETAGWIREHLSVPSAAFDVRRVAITEEDHADPAIPHIPVNMKDPRAHEFVRRYGREVVEVEALPPEELRRRVEDAILAEIDRAAWEKALRREARDRRELRRRLTLAFG